MRIALTVTELAMGQEGKQALAIEGFATAMRQLPTIIADNAGYDSAGLATNLRLAIVNYKKTRDSTCTVERSTLWKSWALLNALE